MPGSGPQHQLFQLPVGHDLGAADDEQLPPDLAVQLPPLRGGERGEEEHSESGQE